MNDLPRQKLCELIATHGRLLCDDPKRCEALLRDFCCEHRREINVLVSALKERVAADLLSSSASVPQQVLHGRLAKRLQDDLALSEEAARWAVESWALALGLIKPSEPAKPPLPPTAPARFQLSIATKTGDDGTTGLMYGRRVPKHDPRVEADGTVNELNAAIGVARASCKEKETAVKLIEIQKELVILMGELGVAVEDRERYQKQGFKFVTAEMVERLGLWVNEIEAQQPKFDGWATPGATLTAAALDVAPSVRVGPE